MMKQLPRISFLVFMLFATLYTGIAIAHGKVSLEQDECLRGAEGSRVHFSGYQPQHDVNAQYCSEIPETGKTYWVVDLIDSALRYMPVGVKIIKEGSKEISARTSPAQHPDGVISGESLLDEGRYTVVITGEGVPPVHYEYPLQVRINSFSSGSHANYVTLSFIALLLLAISWLFYNRSKSDQTSN